MAKITPSPSNVLTTAAPQPPRRNRRRTWLRKRWSRFRAWFGQLELGIGYNWFLVGFILLLLGVLIVWFFPSTRASGSESLLPLPADRMIGGIDALRPDQRLALTAYTSKAESEPTAQSLPDVRVAWVERDKEDKATAVLVVVLADDTSDALQNALGNNDTKLVYRILDAASTPTASSAGPTSVVTPSVVPTMTPTPVSGRVYLRIPWGDIQPDPRSLELGTAEGGNARLVIVTKPEPPPITPNVTPTSAPTRSIIGECVRVIAFLDEDGAQLLQYDKDHEPTHILIELSRERMDTVVFGLTIAEQIWMTTDVDCRPGK